MKIQSLEISAFRGIDKLTVEFFPDSPTVLIGINGVGKSSILDCISLLLSWFVNQLEYDPKSRTTIMQRQGFSYTNNSESALAKGRSIHENEIKNGSDRASAKITASFFDKPVSWTVSTNEKPGIEIIDEVAKIIRNILKENRAKHLPLIIHYPVNRAVLEIPLEVQDNSKVKPILAYEQALDGIKIEFYSFFRWFRLVEDLENEERRDEPDTRDRKLEAVRKAIYSLIPDFSNLRVRRSPLRMTVNKNGEELIVNQLSDGEKCLLAMVGDLARRLAIANPGLPDPLQGEGVVLIDEIELHLHPQWQREIIPALTRTFPNCQFIVTTHSPQIISHVQPENIYVLESTPEGIVAQHPSSSYGRDSNRILEDLMGTPARPQPIKDEILELFRIIDRGDLEAAKQLRDQIIDQIGSDEPELVKADVLMRRKEILKR